MKFTVWPVWKMDSFVFRFFCVALLFWPCQSCFQCFVDVQDFLRLCWGHVLIQSSAKNIDECFRKVERIFNNNEKMIEAARVGKGEKKVFNLFILSNTRSTKWSHVSISQVKASTRSWKRFYLRRLCPWCKSLIRNWTVVTKNSFLFASFSIITSLQLQG